MHHAPPLVVNSELVVLEPLRGSHVVLACPHCGHTGPAAVSKVGVGLPGFQHALHSLKLYNRDGRSRRLSNMFVWCMCAGVRLCDLLLVFPPLLPGLLRSVPLPLLQRLHKGLGLPLLTVWEPVWERAPVIILGAVVWQGKRYCTQCL